MSPGNQLCLNPSDILGSVKESLRNSLFEKSLTCVYSASRVYNHELCLTMEMRERSVI
jgi:hypothetical protein